MAQGGASARNALRFCASIDILVYRRFGLLWTKNSACHGAWTCRSWLLFPPIAAHQNKECKRLCQPTKNSPNKGYIGCV